MQLSRKCNTSFPDNKYHLYLVKLLIAQWFCILDYLILFLYF